MTNLVLSLFCGCGGLDLGFEQAGYTTGLAYDRRPDAVSSWNRNRSAKVARQFDVRELSLQVLDSHYEEEFRPAGVIGGPPCQGFSIANRQGGSDDPRNQLVSDFIDIALSLNSRNPLDFVVMENVPNIKGQRGGGKLEEAVNRLQSAGFKVEQPVLDAANFGVPQHRRRLFLVAFRIGKGKDVSWVKPAESSERFTVRDALAHLPEPKMFERGWDPIDNPFHENHWCMAPKSVKFRDGSLKEGYVEKRSFKTLWWDRPSYTASYGNREVHIHPSGKRRLSVFEALQIQGFPKSFILDGSMSSQITQVSEAVPPPLAFAVANAVRSTLKATYSAAA